MGKIFVLNQDDYSRELLTNKTFAKVTERKKPESANSGFIINKLDSAHRISESKQNGTYHTSILPDVPNLYKHNGMPMQNLGYFIIPRSVTSDPRYKSARLKYQKVLNVLFENVAFAPTTHAIGVKLINIDVGQFCYTIRNFADLCNEGVKHIEDKVDRNTIVRAMTYFEKCQFLRQEVRHGKSLVTITVPDFYKRLKKTSETRVRQERDKNDESVRQEVRHGQSLATISFSKFYDNLKKTSETRARQERDKKKEPVRQEVRQEVRQGKSLVTITVSEFYDRLKKTSETRVRQERDKNGEFVRQEVNHGKSLVNILVPEFYDRLKKTSETTSETRVRQKRDTKEEDKEMKNEYHPSIPSYEKNSIESDLIDDFSSQIKKIEIIPGVWISQADLELCIKIKGSFQAVKTAVESIQNNKKRKRTIVDWPNALLSWKDLNPIQNNAKENILYSKDLYKRFETFKDGLGWRCRHYKSQLKDDQGLLFENESPYIQTYFVSYGDYDFVKKCKNFIQDNFRSLI